MLHGYPSTMINGYADNQITEEEQAKALWFIFRDEAVLLPPNAALKIPTLFESGIRNALLPIDHHYLGLYQNKHCFAVAVPENTEFSNQNVSCFVPIRQAYDVINNLDLFQMLIKGKQLLHWDKSTKYCGYCGAVNQYHTVERAKQCGKCNSMHYPHVAPVILGLIWRGNEIVLARSAHFLPDVYSILAGFVEPGETLEQAVMRETQEEVGLKLKNIRYFGSQPWPFPSNLMIGFTAEYDGGDLCLNDHELEDARWFSIDDLPKLPKPLSLSRIMIDSHIKTIKMKQAALQDVLENPPSTYDAFTELKKNIELFEQLAQTIIAKHGLPIDALTAHDGTNMVFSLGNNRIIKIFPPLHQPHYECELLIMRQLQAKLSIKTPTVEYAGEISGWPYIIMNKLDGSLLEGLWETLDQDNKLILIRELGALIREVHAIPTEGLESIDCHWQQFIKNQITQCEAQHRESMLPEHLLKQLPEYIESVKALIPESITPVILTGEYTPMNLLVKQTSGVWHICGLIDFGDGMLGLAEYDLLGPGVFLIQGDQTLLREFLLSYGFLTSSLTKDLSRQLTALMLLHRYSNLRIQIRIEAWERRVNHFRDLEELVWGL